MRRWIPVTLLLGLTLAASGCTLFRKEPSPAPETVPGGPEVVEEPAPSQDARLALARTAEVLGYPWLADEILAEASRLAQEEGEDGILARSLFIRGFLAWQEGSDEQAFRLIEAARRADPAGPLAEPARLSVELIERLNQKGIELTEMQERLAATEQQIRASEERKRTLEGDVEALRQQLDEIKQIHLRVESEKQDDSP